jgi:hypothetical protein
MFGTEMNFRSCGPYRKHTDAPELTSSHYMPLQSSVQSARKGKSLISPWRRDFVEKMRVVQLVETLSTFYGT